MKKLSLLFLFLAMISLVFVGCQKSEEVISPNGDLNKPGDPVWGPNPVSLGSLPQSVDLVAGQTNVVGHVELTKVDGGLNVKYVLDDAECYVSEVHVDVSKTKEALHVNSQGNPNFGNFDSKTYAVTTFNNDGTVDVFFSLANLTTALGSAPTADGYIFIAIHSGVCCPTGETVATADVCPDLTGADGAKIIPPFGVIGVDAGYENAPYYLNDVKFDKPIVNGEDTFNGWCLDPARGFPDDYAQRALNFLCSFGVTVDPCIVNKPENLKMVNWLINNRGTFSTRAIQGAIWYLLSNETDWQYAGHPIYDAMIGEAILDALPTAEELAAWEPECGDKVLVIAFEPTTDLCDPNNLQVIGIEVEVECENVYGCETAMGFNFPVTTDSQLFPGHVWFRYNGFTW